jgi:surface carbohydrate biosynthesis protein
VIPLEPTHKSRRVLLVVPRLARDLDGHALVAHHLRHSFHHDVQLWTGSGTEQQFLEYAPDVLVLDVVGYEDRLHEATLAKAVGAKVCMLPTAGVFPDEHGFLRLAGEANGGCALLDCYLSWGPFAAEAITSKALIEKSRVEITGCPRFDFYANEKLAGLEDRKTFLKAVGARAIDGPVILWCTGASNYNNLGRNVEKYIRRVSANSGFVASEFRIEIEDERQQLETHSHVILDLANRHPNWNFLVKVHPLEDRRFYLNWARQSRNISIVPNISFQDFVFHCDILLQRGCTTATEFWTRDKPVLELQMGRFRTSWTPREHTDGNHSVFTTDEASNAISYYLGGGSISSHQRGAREAYLHKFYYRIDGMSAYRCAARINSEITGNTYTDQHQQLMRQKLDELRIRRDSDRRSLLLAYARKILGIDPHRTLRVWRQSFRTPPSRINAETLTRLYEKFESARTT